LITFHCNPVTLKPFNHSYKLIYFVACLLLTMLNLCSLGFVMLCV